MILHLTADQQILRELPSPKYTNGSARYDRTASDSVNKPGLL
ncbi:hypothetical protein [Moorena sp. SIO3H5]|nr:hypothetical protein [Moorena sp. SIO3H5]